MCSKCRGRRSNYKNNNFKKLANVFMDSMLEKKFFTGFSLLFGCFKKGRNTIVFSSGWFECAMNLGCACNVCVDFVFHFGQEDATRWGRGKRV